MTKLVLQKATFQTFRKKMDSSSIEFREVYEKYHEKILRYLAKMVGSNEAEDLCQDVFVKINKSLDSFRKESKLSTWIYRIATNSALDYLRSRTHKLQDSAKTIDDEKSAGINQLGDNKRKPTADQQLIRDEMSDCVKGYVEDLPQDYRVVLVLSEVEELQNQEIAEALGISLDNVKIRLHRARTKLKDSLSKSCNFYHNDQNVLACDKKQK